MKGQSIDTATIYGEVWAGWGWPPDLGATVGVGSVTCGGWCQKGICLYWDWVVYGGKRGRLLLFIFMMVVSDRQVGWLQLHHV